MSKENLSKASKTNWKKLNTMADEEIDLSDIPEITAEQFAKAKTTAEFFAERGIPYDSSHTVRIIHEDGSEENYTVPSRRLVVLDPDVSAYFPDSNAVNQTLRQLIELIPDSKLTQSP